MRTGETLSKTVFGRAAEITLQDNVQFYFGKFKLKKNLKGKQQARKKSR